MPSISIANAIVMYDPKTKRTQINRDVILSLNILYYQSVTVNNKL